MLLDRRKGTTKVSWLGNCYLSLHYGAVSSWLVPMGRVIGLKQYMPGLMIRFLLWCSLIPVYLMPIHQDHLNEYDCSNVSDATLHNMSKLIIRFTRRNYITITRLKTAQIKGISVSHGIYWTSGMSKTIARHFSIRNTVSAKHSFCICFPSFHFCEF